MTTIMLSTAALQQQHQLLNLARNKLIICASMESRKKQSDLRKLVAHANLYDKVSATIIINNNIIKEQYLREKQNQQVFTPYDSDSNEDDESDSDKDWESASDTDSESDSEYDYDYNNEFGNEIESMSTPRDYNNDELLDINLLPTVSHTEVFNRHIKMPDFSPVKSKYISA